MGSVLQQASLSPELPSKSFGCPAKNCSHCTDDVHGWIRVFDCVAAKIRLYITALKNAITDKALKNWVANLAMPHARIQCRPKIDTRSIRIF
jgi:hypothetical protein